MRVENIFHGIDMKDGRKRRPAASKQDPKLLSEPQRAKFQALVDDATELERVINGMIVAFEEKNKLSCWISTEKHNKISIDIAVDEQNL